MTGRPKSPERDKPKCGGKLRGGREGTCTRPAGWGTKHVGTGKCKLHGGSTGSHQVAAQRAAAKEHVADELRMWSLDGYDPGSVDYTATLLQLIGFWRYKFDRLNQLLGEAFNAAERLKQAHAAEKITLVDAEAEGYDEHTEEPIPENPAYATARKDLERIFSLGGVSALVGVKYDADRYGRVYPVEEGIRGLEKLASEASEHLARNCVRAGQLKISAQRQEWAQQMGLRFAAMMEAIVNAGSPSMEQRLAMQAELERQLRQMFAVGSVVDGQLVQAGG